MRVFASHFETPTYNLGACLLSFAGIHRGLVYGMVVVLVRVRVLVLVLVLVRMLVLLLVLVRVLMLVLVECVLAFVCWHTRWLELCSWEGASVIVVAVPIVERKPEELNRETSHAHKKTSLGRFGV